MSIKVYKKNTAARRKMSIVSRKDLAKKPVGKNLLTSLKSRAGRNNRGVITCRHRGGGEKRAYRPIDFNQTDKLGIPAKIESLEYDPNRTAFIALVCYADGERRYQLATNGLQVGDQVLTAAKTKIAPGNRCQLENIPAGFEVFNVEIKPKCGGILARSAGARVKVIATDNNQTQIQLPSSEIRLLNRKCFATIGIATNLEHSNIKLGKAGRVRHSGRRPQVRGKVMNPVDHRHGGGEGRAPIGLKAPRTPWGALALGVKTRRPKKYSDKSIIKPRKPGRFSRRRK